MTDQYSAIACDVGGTNFRVAVCDQRGVLHHVRKEPVLSFQTGATAAEIVADLADRIQQFQRQMRDHLSEDAPLVCSVPGPVEGRRRILAAPPLLGDVVDVPDLYGQLCGERRGPVQIINDMSAAAWFLSTVSDRDRFLAVTISSGIGSKIFDRSHPLGVIDDLPFAGEIGHQTVDTSANTPDCDCGGTGHLGAIASARGFERAARRSALADPQPFAASDCVRRFGATAETLNNELHLVPAVRSGDRWATEVLGQGLRFLAQSLVASILTAAIDRIVIIGGFAQALGQVYAEMLTREIQAITRPGGFSPDPSGLIVVRQTDENTCLLGAAVCAQRLRQPT